MFQRDTCSSGTDHYQIPSWSLKCRHGQYNVISTLRCKNEEKTLNKLSTKDVKTFSELLSCMIELFMDSSNMKDSHGLDASRFFHDELSSLDSSMIV